MGILDAPVNPAAIGAVPRWKAGTAYTAGQQILAPSGQVVAARTAFTSGTIYDPSKWRTADSFLRFKNALANVERAPVDIMAIGDSITEGAGSSATGARWLDKLRDDLRAKYQPFGVTGAGVTPTAKGGVGYVPASAAYSYVAPLTWTFTGTSSAGASEGLGFWNYTFGPGTATLTFTGTAIRVFYNDYYGLPNATVTIDGNAVASITSARTSAGSNPSSFKDYTGLTSGSHTIVLTVSSGTFNLEGAMIFDGDETKGIRVWANAHSGSTTFNDGNRIPRQLAAVNPSISTIYFGTNEYRNNVPVATFKSLLSGLATMVKSNTRPGSSILLISGYTPVHAGTPVATWQAYKDVVSQVATEVGCELLDLKPIFDATPSHLSGDGVHPSPAGHIAIKDAVLGALSVI